MFLRRPEDAVHDGSEALHAMARQKVQAAIAGLGQATHTAAPAPVVPAAIASGPHLQPEPLTGPADVDPVVQQALDRMHEQLGDVCALDRDGRELTWAELASVVIGPLGARSRDADTTMALLEAVTPHDPPPAPAHIYAGLLAEQPHAGEPVVSQHQSLENGAHRYVFRAEERNPWSEAAQAREDLLVTALETRYPDGMSEEVDRTA